MLAHNLLTGSIKQFEYYKLLGEKSINQLPENELFNQHHSGSNSIAIIVKHLWGNMMSRWTDFLNSDGEKPWRKRDEEFENELKTKVALLEKWEEGWACLLNTLRSLSPEDLNKIIYIRNEGHSVAEAINRQLCHYSYHVGQIVFLAKLLKGEEWESLSIPKGNSAQFNKAKFAEEKTRKHFTNKKDS